MPTIETASANKITVVRDKSGLHNATLTVDGKTQLFRQNRIEAMGVGIRALKLRVTGKKYGHNAAVPLQIQRYYTGEAYLPHGGIEIIGDPASRTQNLSVGIYIYDEAELEITREALGMNEEAFGKPSVLLSHQGRETELGLSAEWWMDIYVSDSLFAEIDKSQNSSHLERISFNIRFENVFWEAQKNDAGYSFTGSTHYLLQWEGFDVIYGNLENVFIDYRSQSDNIKDAFYQNKGEF